MRPLFLRHNWGGLLAQCLSPEPLARHKQREEQEEYEEEEQQQRRQHHHHHHHQRHHRPLSPPPCRSVEVRDLPPRHKVKFIGLGRLRKLELLSRNLMLTGWKESKKWKDTSTTHFDF